MLILLFIQQFNKQEAHIKKHSVAVTYASLQRSYLSVAYVSNSASLKNKKVINTLQTEREMSVIFTSQGITVSFTMATFLK